MILAGGVVFFVLLSIFPTIAAFVSIYALFADAHSLGRLLEVAAGIMPADAYDILRSEVTRIANKGNGTLGFTSVVALALALWSASSGTKAVFDALNIIYEENEKRGWIRFTLVSLAFTAGLIAFLLLAAVLVIVAPIALSAIGLRETGEVLIASLRWPLLFAVAVAGLSVLYRYGPSRRDAKWRWITVGSALASLAWLVASGLFSWYLSNLADYTATYGALGAVIGLLMWLWLTFIIVLVGAELDAEIEHQTARDSTVGVEKPMGARGANMADEVGPAQL